MMVGLRGSSGPAAPTPAPSQAATNGDAAKVKTAQAPAANPAPAAAQWSNTIGGAQPAPSSTNFDNRWSAFR